MPNSMRSYGATPKIKDSKQGGMKRHNHKMKGNNYNKEKPGVDKQTSNGVKK